MPNLNKKTSSIVEFKVRKVVRYHVTRFEENGESGAAGSISYGEFPSEESAYEVGYALAKDAYHFYEKQNPSLKVIFPTPIGIDYCDILESRIEAQDQD